jgi:hypothetical protein
MDVSKIREFDASKETLHSWLGQFPYDIPVGDIRRAMRIIGRFDGPLPLKTEIILTYTDPVAVRCPGGCGGQVAIPRNIADALVAGKYDRYTAPCGDTFRLNLPALIRRIKEAI